MKNAYIENCLKDLEAFENETKKKAKSNERWTYYCSLITILFGLAIVAFSWPSALVCGIGAATILYNRAKEKRMNKKIYERITNERAHLGELKSKTPDGSQNAQANRMTRMRQLAQARNQKRAEQASARKFCNVLSFATVALAYGAAFVTPVLAPLGFATGVSMVIAGEVEERRNRERHQLAAEKNNVDNDISVVQEDAKDKRAAALRVQRQRQNAAVQQATAQRQAQNTNGNRRPPMPRAAVNTANEAVVDAYLEQLSHPVTKETVKQKIK